MTRQRKAVWASRGGKLWVINIWEKLIKDIGYFSEICYSDSISCCLWGDKSVSGDFPLAGMGVGRRDIFTKGNLYFAFRQKGEGRELFPHLLFLSCLQFEIILTPTWYILRWHILISFSVMGLRFP